MFWAKHLHGFGLDSKLGWTDDFGGEEDGSKYIYIFVSLDWKYTYYIFFLGKISFSSLNYHKSLFFVPKVSKILFSSLNFSKRTDFCPSIYFC